MRRRSSLASLCVLLATATLSAQTAVLQEVQQIVSSDVASTDFFGRSVSTWTDWLIVGAESDDTAVFNSGSAYLFRHDGTEWVEQQQLVASDAEFLAAFGVSVAMSDGVAVIGAPGVAAAYIFRWDGATWHEEAKLMASDGTTGSFGRRVDIWSDDTVIIGAPNAGSSLSTGAAFVFRFNGFNWVEEQKLTASDGEDQDFFGASVAIRAQHAWIGAGGDDDFGTDSGAVYAFRWNGSTWVEEQKITPTDVAALDNFGNQVAISNDVAIGTALGDDDVGSIGGSATVFRWNGSDWVEEQKLLPSDGMADDAFGPSVDLRGDVALIGSRSDDGQGPFSGSAYLYRYDGGSWLETEKLLASDGDSGDGFAFDATLSADVAIVGAPSHDGFAFGGGAVYVYEIGTPFLRGDANGDGLYDLADPITTLSYLFMAATVSCLDAADANDDETLNVADAIQSLTVLFGDGVLPPPTPGCGSDPTPGELGCQEFGCP